MPTENLCTENASASGTWKLQEAQAHFSEVVRRAQSDGPQWVTVNGKQSVVILSAAEYAKMKPAVVVDVRGRTGADLIAAMQKGRRLGLRLRRTRT
jgi:prevent-host-death family protein